MASYRITVAGVGGAGGQCVQRMVDDGLSGVRCIAVDTDWASLALLTVPTRLRIGEHLTRGLGAGGRQELGARAAEEAREAIRQALGAPDLAYVVAGLGGGTGTGAAPVVAGIARETGALTVGVATLPFAFEGARRRRIAGEGLPAFRESVHTLILVPDEAALGLMDPHSTTILGAFKAIDGIVALAVRSVTDLLVRPGLLLINLDTLRDLLVEGGRACFGFAEAEGEERALRAAEGALACPLLGVPLATAAGLIVNVTGGPDLALIEVKEAVEAIVGAAGPDPRLVYGCVIEDAMAGRVRVSLLATGLPVSSIPVYRLAPGVAPQAPFSRAT